MSCGDHSQDSLWTRQKHSVGKRDVVCGHVVQTRLRSGRQQQRQMCRVGRVVIRLYSQYPASTLCQTLTSVTRYASQHESWRYPHCDATLQMSSQMLRATSHIVALSWWAQFTVLHFHFSCIVHIHQPPLQVIIEVLVLHAPDEFDTGIPHCPLNASESSGSLILRVVMHNRKTPCSMDQSNDSHAFHQGCCANVFCRLISRILRDLNQFHSLCTEFFLNPQVSGFHVSHSTETDPSP